MEIKEHGNWLIVSLEVGDDQVDLVTQLTELIAKNKDRNFQILVSVDETVDEILARLDAMKADNATMLDVQNILQFGIMGDTHIGLKSNHSSLTSRSRGSNHPYYRRQAVSKDPSKGFNGLPTKRGKGKLH